MRRIDPKNLDKNVFTAIGEQWMLITAGTPEKCNTMTASWGGLGVIWNAPAATCYIRPQRYTKEFASFNKFSALYLLCPYKLLGLIGVDWSIILLDSFFPIP